ncbi:MAG TPA: DNA polymerase III subunit delta [Phototrophicaceae bacterium]|nr:DNA polymerase III subunit delta [Phototrophicaceae bacterium]
MATPTFYIFHGDDEFRIDEEVGAMLAKMKDQPNGDLNTAEFDGTQTPVAEILSSALAYPFLSDKRLIIVKEMLAWITRKGAGETGKQAVEQWLTELPHLPEWTRLVFVERGKLADSNKILKLAQSGDNGFEKAFFVPKDSTSWIIKRAQDSYNVKIEPAAATALASVTVGDLRRADNELFKLVTYVDGARPISEADVALLTPYVAEASMFEMVDALAEGRGKVAVSLIHRLLDQDEDVFGLFGMITRQFRLLLLAKEHLTSGGAPKDIASAIGVHPFVGEKLAKQTRAFSLEQLEKVYRTLQDYDFKMKTGQIEPLLALDLLIAGLTR